MSERVFTEDDIKALLRFAYTEGRAERIHYRDRQGQLCDVADALLDRYRELSHARSAMYPPLSGSCV